MSKIAIIEDDVIISQMYRMKLESEGFEVQLASSGDRGIALTEQLKPDLILLDLQMPGMDGFETLKKLRAIEISKNTPVIILTNLGEEEAPDGIEALGVASYIIKANMTPKEVVAQVKQTLNLS